LSKIGKNNLHFKLQFLSEEKNGDLYEDEMLLNKHIQQLEEQSGVQFPERMIKKAKRRLKQSQAKQASSPKEGGYSSGA